MKIGLVRHFRVDLKKRKMMTSKEYNEHSYNYERAGVIPNELVLDEEWDKCYCSSMPRAMTTAKTIYHGEIIVTDKLVEILASATFNVNIRIPYHMWAAVNRIAWARNHGSQPEGKKESVKRINEIMDVILKEKGKNILIVSHAGTLYEVQKILRRNGFTGESFLQANNGRLYTYENKGF
jgi:broad specificity phosphatase PhoE